MSSALVKISVMLLLVGVAVADYYPTLQNPALEGPVTKVCLNCICYAATRCQNLECNGETCGEFAITRGFWDDSGRYTVNEESAMSADAVYQSCTRDTYCATRSVQEYMRKFALDCNGDGRVDCFDYMAIHRKGRNACSSELPRNYVHRFNWCIATAAGA